MLCQAHLQYTVVGKCCLYDYEVCVRFLKGLVERETRRHQTHVYVKPFPELRDVRFKLSLFRLLNTQGNSCWFKFSSQVVQPALGDSCNSREGGRLLGGYQLGMARGHHGWLSCAASE